MAGIPKMVLVVNRTTRPLDAMFDGQPVVLLPGYMLAPKEGDEEKDKPKLVIVGAGPAGAVVTNSLPYFAAELVKRQNPVMGTEDPEAPNVFDSLIGVVEWGDDISHLEQSDAIERLDRELLDDDAQRARPTARSKANKKRGSRRYTDNRLKSPAAIRGDFGD
jgi:hypothetical protein